MLPRTKFKENSVLHTATVFMSHCSYSAHTRSHTHSPHVPSTADALHDLDIIFIAVAQTRLTVAINTAKSSSVQESVGIQTCSSSRKPVRHPNKALQIITYCKKIINHAACPLALRDPVDDPCDRFICR